MQGSSLPPCPPTAIHTWSWQSSASAPLPYAPSFLGGTRRKKTGCRGSTRNFPCPRPRREARRHNRKPCLKYLAENRKIFLRLPRTVNRRQHRRPGAVLLSVSGQFELSLRTGEGLLFQGAGNLQPQHKPDWTAPAKLGPHGRCSMGRR